VNESISKAKLSVILKQQPLFQEDDIGWKNKMRGENERLNKSLNREKAEVKKAEEEVENFKGKLRNLADNHEKLRSKLSHEREDYSKQVCSLTQRETKYQSEMGKKDRELLALKESITLRSNPNPIDPMSF